MNEFRTGVGDEPIAPLNDEERAELARCEDVIRKNLLAFTMVGDAMRTVAGRKLYRETDGDFHAWVRRNFKLIPGRPGATARWTSRRADHDD